MKRIPRSVFTTNPTRIQYCTQEITVFREDILTKMCRNCVHFPESGDISMHVSLKMARTALCICFCIHEKTSYSSHYYSTDLRDAHLN